MWGDKRGDDKKMAIGARVGARRPVWRGQAHARIAHLSLVLALATVLFARSSAQDLAFGTELSEKTTFSYTSHADLLETTHRIASGTCQKYAKVEVLGQSTEGAEIVALRLRKEVTLDAPARPKVKIVGNLHGDEPTGSAREPYIERECGVQVRSHHVELRRRRVSAEPQHGEVW